MTIDLDAIKVRLAAPRAAGVRDITVRLADSRLCVFVRMLDWNGTTGHEAYAAVTNMLGHAPGDLTALVAEVERLRYLLKKATGIIPHDVAEATVFSQRGDPCTHKFQHKYADEAACGHRPRGPYQPLREEDLTCPDCIDVIRAVGLASETIERGEHE